MDTLNIYRSILPELKKIAIWCKNPSSSVGFDLEEYCQKVFQEYGISRDFGQFYLILYLVENLQDSIEHNIPEIGLGYPIESGISDLDTIIHLIEKGNIEELENSFETIIRIYKSMR